jgi:hypothetical protein
MSVRFGSSSCTLEPAHFANGGGSTFPAHRHRRPLHGRLGISDPQDAQARRIVAHVALTAAGILLIIAIHWGPFG